MGETEGSGSKTTGLGRFVHGVYELRTSKFPSKVADVEEGEGGLGLSVRLGVERQRNGRGSWNLREKEEQRFGNGPGE